MTKVTVLLLVAGGLSGLEPTLPLSQMVHEEWNGTRGLTEASVRTMAQAGDGYLYVGTQDGLFRFNGDSFVVVDLGAEGRAGTNSVSALLVDGDSLWVGTRGGLFRLRAGRLVEGATGSGLEQASILSLARGSDGKIWVGDTKGLVRLGGGAAKRWNKANGLPGEQIRRIVPDGAALWLCTLDAGLVRWQDGRAEVVSGMPSQQVSDVAVDRQGRWWVATNQGIGRVEANRFVRDERLGGVKVYNLLVDREDHLWVAHMQGLSRLRGEKLESLEWPDATLSRASWGLLADQAGSIWFGSMARGLHRLRRGSFISYGAAEGMSERMGLVVRRARDGGVWLGSEEGLYHQRGGVVRRFGAREGLPEGEVTAVDEDETGGLWVGTPRGLRRLERGVARGGYGALLDGVMIHDVVAGAAGQAWVGTDAGLVHWDGEKARLMGEGECAARVPVGNLMRGRDGALWISLQNTGLCRMKDNQWKLFRKEDGLGANSVFGLSEDASGVVWSGGYGLARFDGQRWFRFESKHGVPRGFVYQVVDDERGHLWLAGKGVWRIARRELEEVAMGKRQRVVAMRFGEQDGMRSGECVGGESPPAAMDREGRIWFATGKGFAMVDPTKLLRPWGSVAPIVRDVVADGSRLQGAVVRVAAGTQQLELAIDAANLVQGEATRFRYRMSGFDRDWIHAGSRRVAIYNVLPPGEYRFEVEAETEGGNWRRASEALTIVQEPHYWQTLWFRLGGAALLGALLVWAYCWRLKQLQGRIDAMLHERHEERIRIARELHDTVLPELLGATVQLELVRGQLPQGAKEAVATAIDIIERAQRDTRGVVLDLRMTQVMGGHLAAAMKAYGERHGYPRGVNVVVQCTAELGGLRPEVATTLYRVAQEAMSNAFRHAHPAQIAIELSEDAEAIRLVVKDDGRGFAVETSGREDNFGLVGMQERIRALNGDFMIESATGKGTTVTVVVPRSGRRSMQAAQG